MKSVAKDHRIVAIDHALEAQKAQTVERGRCLDQERAEKKGGMKAAGKRR
jgi:hypothetical protein